MPVLPFDPLKMGFHFANGTFKFNMGIANCTVLCGGMSYACIDYQAAKFRMPDLTDAPADMNPLEQYLYDRQATAHKYTWYKFLGNWLGGDPSAQEEADNVAELIGLLNQQKMGVICLYNYVGQGHHIVAHGCDAAGTVLNIWDSNHPDLMGFLRKEGVGQWRNSMDKALWRGWFVDQGVYKEPPRVPPLAWKYCRGCHVMHCTSFEAFPGVCKSNGLHVDSPNYEYFLPWGSSQLGQHGWRLCNSCMNLYLPSKNGSPIKCPKGGDHVEVKFGDFRVMAWDGLGERNWFRCGTCSSMFWSEDGQPAGMCADGNKHARAPGSSPYVIDYRTVKNVA